MLKEVMDTSTITFFITLIVAFVFLRWFISPDLPDSSQDQEGSALANGSSQRSFTSSGAATTLANGVLQRRGPRRSVNDDMVQVVKTIAPDLTISQIRYDLENTGSVSATVENYLANGSLPYPPGETATIASSNSGRGDDKVQKFQDKPINLIERYNLQEKVQNLNACDDDNENENDTDYKQSKDFDFSKRREQMILKARRDLQKNLASRAV